MLLLLLLWTTQALYKEWCRINSEPLELLTPSLLQANYGISQKAIASRYLTRVFGEDQQLSFNERVHDALARFFSAETLLNMLRVWWVRDLLTGLFQTVIILGAPMAVIVPAYITDAFFTVSFQINRRTTIYSPDQNLLFMMFVNPWQLVVEPHSHIQAAAAISLSVWLLLILEALMTYAVDPIEENIKRLLVPRPPPAHQSFPQSWLYPIRRYIRLFVKGVCALLLCSWLGYAVLVCVWFIFGACIKPELFLPYATAAVAFITFALGKANSLQTVQREIRELVLKSTQHELSELLADSKSLANKVFSGQVLSGQLQAFDSDILDSATATVSSIAGSSKDIMALFNGVVDLDFQNIAKLMSFNEEAIVGLAQKWGIKPSIVTLMIAASHRDEMRVLKSLEVVCKEAGIDVQHDVIVTILNLVKCGIKVAESSDDAEARVQFDFATQDIFNTLINSELVESMMKQANPDLPVDFASVRKYKAFLSMIFNAVVGLLRGDSDISALSNVFSDFCEDITSSVLELRAKLMDLQVSSQFLQLILASSSGQTESSVPEVIDLILSRWKWIPLETLVQLSEPSVLPNIAKHFKVLRALVDTMRRQPIEDLRVAFPGALDAFIAGLSNDGAALDTWKQQRLGHRGFWCTGWSCKRKPRDVEEEDEESKGTESKANSKDGAMLMSLICVHAPMGRDGNHHWSCCGSTQAEKGSLCAANVRCFLSILFLSFFLFLFL